MAVAADQMVRQARSAYYLTANGSLSGAYAEHASRVAAGGLNNSIIYDRYSNGVMVKQLVTDFGRTRKLVISSSLHARAEQENIVTARANTLLQVDQSYYEVLEAQSVLRIAQGTIRDRQLISDQVASLAGNKLRLTWMLVLQTWIWIKRGYCCGEGRAETESHQLDEAK